MWESSTYWHGNGFSFRKKEFVKGNKCYFNNTVYSFVVELKVWSNLPQC
jgi:hypothetical protein